jgi:hypothetical protein
VRGSGATGTQIYVTGFNSDTLGVVTVGAAAMTVGRVDLAHTTNAFSTTNFSGIMRGPRGLALNSAQTRVYVYNRIDASVTVVDSTANPPSVVGNFALQRDPTPAYIKNGRKFLYSSKLSGGGNVSCASCHIDAGSDFLAWNLSDGVHVGPSRNPTTGGDPQGFLGENALQESVNFDDRKGPMQTQSLRGLVNFEVANDTVQDAFFSNKPYHWRGDRATFQDFNGAFIHLMAIPNPHSQPTQGIPPAQMTNYREFINSVHYAPNPEQPITRLYSGSMSTPQPPGSTGNPLDDPNAGSGAAWGLKNFHIQNTDGRACVHCHSLPEGSNNRFTDSFAWESTDLDRSRFETTALRALVSKEAELWRLNTVTGSVEAKFAMGGTAPVKTGEFGLVHSGLSTLVTQVNGSTAVGFGSRSIVDFVDGFPSGMLGMSTAQVNAVSRFMREFDSGVGPIIGRAATVVMGGAVSPDLAEMENQAQRCNAAVAVYARLNGIVRGFWFDVTQTTTTPYVEEPQTGVATIGPFTRAQLLALLLTANDLLVFQSVPLGSARRVAHLGVGPVPTLLPTAPTAITLQGCRPGIQNATVPALTVQWLDLFSQTSYNSNPGLNLGNNKSMIYYQGSLKTHAATATPVGFGLANFRHEPPRRFVVRGTGIKEGAWLRIFLPKTTDWATATQTTAPTTTPNVTSHPNPIEVPLYAAIERATGILEWQSGVEIEPYHLLALMNGGPASSAVTTAVNDPAQLDLVNPPIFQQSGTGPTTDFFNPRLRNWYYVQVINDPNVPASTSAGSWQRLTLQ